MQKKVLHDVNPNRVCGTYWNEKFCQVARGRTDNQEAPEQLAAEYANLSSFPRFVAKSLLDHSESFPVLTNFTAPLMQLQKDRPHVFPKKATIDVLAQMVAQDPTVETKLDTTFLTPEAEARLVNSPLWSAYEDRCFDVKLAKVKMIKIDDAAFMPLL